MSKLKEFYIKTLTSFFIGLSIFKFSQIRYYNSVSGFSFATAVEMDELVHAASYLFICVLHSNLQIKNFPFLSSYFHHYSKFKNISTYI